MGSGKVNIIRGVCHPLGGVGKYPLCTRLMKPTNAGAVTAVLCWSMAPRFFSIFKNENIE